MIITKLQKHDEGMTNFTGFKNVDITRSENLFVKRALVVRFWVSSFASDSDIGINSWERFG